MPNTTWDVSAAVRAKLVSNIFSVNPLGAWIHGKTVRTRYSTKTFNQVVDDIYDRLSGVLGEDDFDEHTEELSPSARWRIERLHLYLDTWDVEILEELILRRASEGKFTEEDFQMYDRYAKLKELAAGTPYEGERHNAERQARKVAEGLAGIPHIRSPEERVGPARPQVRS